ncbi:Usher syndrome type-1C protein-binding protein 1 [Onychomys torridus]|uniref:Usher syndrome type-1C protein-binding protein 1 n=1 Tax=Onychomys torridus TaxID=38674 RepID=UPI00167FD458|nr:Usher syndrome type-1C protein-binding protein 1 [Onychomys torridus]XP_036022770.1 Usher syndrome type-1C protein-binding protein 1 [Onychomys torridus]XP_036022771.1 Usher syndrome type-1C protein-binding protein 1 [Onychomys torridus]XP_036022773.1 Usher syndrome type-1C protein-binding protein 1 [Onychomys torridus]XP_036022774.1 Usher syndrome type-1C protein-binding protein 1 [Onychomys torridus]
MSARATRPRSRRGRHPPPGELDPVAESSEEVEATNGSFEAKPGLLQEHLGPDLQSPGTRPEDDFGVGFHGALALKPEERCEPEVEGHQTPPAAPLNSSPAETPVPSMFETLESRLSSLEATVAAWRHRSPSFPRPVEGKDRGQGAPGSFGDQEEAGPGQQEAACLIERNAWLRLALGSREDELACTQASLQDAQAEKETLQRQVQELEDSLMRLEASPPVPLLRAGRTNSNSSSSEAEGEPWAPQDAPLAHPLLRRLRSDSSTQIFGCLSTQRSTREMHLMEDQMGQLQGNIEKLKCFNRLLLAVLQGYKGRCESLSMQLGQREAEATALHLALQYSEDCEEAYGVLLALRTAGSGAEATKSDLQAAEKEASKLLVEKEAAMDGETPRPSPEGSSVDKPTPQELAAQLHGYIQHLRERWALVKMPPALGPGTTPRPTMPHAEATVQAILEIQPGPALPRLEKSQIQQDLVDTRDGLADLVLRLQLARREKRGLELREAALRAQGPAHLLLLQQLGWERAHLAGDGGSSRGSSEDPSSEEEDQEEEQQHQGPPALAGGQMSRAWDSETLSQELSASLARAADLQAQLQALRRQLEQVAQKGRTRRAQSAELNRELCKAHSSLVLAFRGAHRKQEEQRRKLEQQVARMQAQQAEELAALAATARALGKPGAPQPGQTFL